MQNFSEDRKEPLTEEEKKQVDELWGASKDDDWKARETERIRKEKGVISGEAPMVGDELP